MPLAYSCPHCGRRTKVAEMDAAQIGPCAKCGQPLVVSDPNGAASAQRGMWGARIAGNILAVSLVLVFIYAGVLMTRRPSIPRIRSEIAMLDMALNAFKEKVGDYPPDGTDPAEVRRFVAFAFPRYSGPPPDTGDPAKALVFWLSGWSANPTEPFGEGTNRIGPFFDFDPARLRGGMYYPPNAGGDTEPYVYFKAREDGTYAGQFQTSNGSLVRPCKDSRAGGFVNPTSFQLRSPGRDGRHGSGVDFPRGTDYDQYQQDDLSNFDRGTFQFQMEEFASGRE